LFDQPAIESDAFAIGFDLRSGRLQQASRFRVQEIDANFFENRQGGGVNGLEFVVTDCRNGPKWQARLRLRRPVCGGGGIPANAFAPTAPTRPPFTRYLNHEIPFARSA
jgi:hypothetical protein